ncbi:MAG: glcC 3, partial [Aeromicrobium sp.]|nr:glcC 3 [Aeromicrobium sp.]
MTIGPVRAQPSRTGKVASRKVADLVASRLRMMIARGELQEGDWLPTEAELTEQFGVSRPTLREAFRLLEGDGLVQIRRGPPGGARVQLPGPEQAARLFGLILTLSGTTLKDVYEARMVLEPAAVAQLAASPGGDAATELRNLIAEARAVIHDDESFAAATTAFHVRLVRLSGNHTLAAVSGMLSEITTRHVAL